MSWSNNLDLIVKSGEKVHFKGGKDGVHILDSTDNQVCARPFTSFAEARRFCSQFGVKFEEVNKKTALKDDLAGGQADGGTTGCTTSQS